MAFTSSDLAAIEAAIASGELSVQYADRRVQYRSMDDLIKARDAITKAINDSAGNRRPRMTRLSVGKGV